SQDAFRYLQELGVKVKVNTQVTGYDGNTISFSNGECIDTKTVIWGAGVMGQFPAGIPTEIIQRGNRIATDGQCRVETMQDIYAIGDVSAIITEQTPRGLPGVAPVAQQQGAYVANHILNSINGTKNNSDFK